MSRYVVLVKPKGEDHPAYAEVYGVYQSKAKADWFASKINEKVEQIEEAGYAWVLPVRKPVVVRGRRLAKFGLDAVSFQERIPPTALDGPDHRGDDLCRFDWSELPGAPPIPGDPEDPVHGHPFWESELSPAEQMGRIGG